MLLYIDDRLVEEVRHASIPSSPTSATLAIYIVAEILIRLGYCLNLTKSIFTPTQTPTFLGFIVDSTRHCFKLTESKLNKFAKFRDHCLDMTYVSVLELQRLAGRCVSFRLAIPAAKLYTREINRAIAHGMKSGSRVRVDGALREEIEHWKFVDNWDGCLKWKPERHLSVTASSDSSLFKWAGHTVVPGQGKVEISDFWPDSMKQFPIMVLEAYALLRVLESLALFLDHGRVDVHVDNKVLIAAWNNEGCKSPELNVALKQIFNFTVENDIFLNLIYVKSANNLADAPSRSIKSIDSTLTDSSWSLIQTYFGHNTGHTFDLMALDSNCMKDGKGNVLPHYTPYLTPNTSGVNVFAQMLGTGENYYVFPPAPLVAAVMKFLTDSVVTCSVVVSCDGTIPVWFPSVVERIGDSFIIGTVGQPGCLSAPSKSGYVVDQQGLKQSLWVIRLQPHTARATYGRLLFGLNPRIEDRYKCLCIGDSILRGLCHDDGFHNPLVRVVALGGATVGKVCGTLTDELVRQRPLVVFVHAGVNNLSKTFLYTNEFHQMTSTIDELNAMEALLTNYVSHFVQTKVIVSHILVTNDRAINARAKIINSELQKICSRHQWLCMHHDNIYSRHLRDSVHLNDVGHDLFVRNIVRCLEKIM